MEPSALTAATLKMIAAPSKIRMVLRISPTSLKAAVSDV
jgi:hypothetical protein